MRCRYQLQPYFLGSFTTANSIPKSILYWKEEAVYLVQLSVSGFSREIATNHVRQ
jgi:hypothetical protein